jgi:hypothetical protein
MVYSSAVEVRPAGFSVTAYRCSRTICFPSTAELREACGRFPNKNCRILRYDIEHLLNIQFTIVVHRTIVRVVG